MLQSNKFSLAKSLGELLSWAFSIIVGLPVIDLSSDEQQVLATSYQPQLHFWREVLIEVPIGVLLWVLNGSLMEALDGGPNRISNRISLTEVLTAVRTSWGSVRFSLFLNYKSAKLKYTRWVLDTHIVSITLEIEWRLRVCTELNMQNRLRSRHTHHD